MYQTDPDNQVLTKKQKRALNKKRKANKQPQVIPAPPPPATHECAVCGIQLNQSQIATTGPTTTCESMGRWVHNLEVICGILADQYATKKDSSTKRGRLLDFIVVCANFVADNYMINKDIFYAHLVTHIDAHPSFLLKVRERINTREWPATEAIAAYTPVLNAVLDPPGTDFVMKGCPNVEGHYDE